MERISKARAGLILDHPFFGSLALRLTVIEDKSAETMWTDGNRLGFNPEWTESLSMEETKGVICHEVMHCAMGHMSRRGAREHKLWNVACDLAINPILIEAGAKLPAGGLFEARFTGKSAEEIYTILQQENQEGSGGSAECGNQGQSDPGKCGEVRDAKDDAGNTSQSIQEQVAKEWKISTNQAATQAKAQGNLPSAIQRLVDELVDPKANWREILRRFVDSHAKNDYAWFPPNRRHIHNGLFLPSLRSEELGHIVAVVDTSGSITREMVNQFGAELSAVLQDHLASITVIYCDAEVSEEHVQEFGEYDLPLQLHPVGGGGTDFKPPFKYLAERDIVPTCLVYFTDGECNSFPSEPAYPVLWAMTADEGGYYYHRPPFGEVVSIE